MHFDYPYFAEPNDGLGDEILGHVWQRNGNVKLVGTEIPNDAIVTDTPKFGYRCLQTSANTDYISAETDAFSMIATSNYEFAFWIRVTASQAGNIVVILNGTSTVCTIGVNADRKLTCSFSSGATGTCSVALALNTWTQCKVAFTTSGVIFTVNANPYTVSLSRPAVTATECRIGGFAGQLDEFVFRLNQSESTYSEPVRAVLRATDLGGYGDGSLGDVTISANCVMNTVAYANKKYGYKFPMWYCIAGGRQGKFGGGLKLLVDKTGKFVLTRVQAAGNNGTELAFGSGYYSSNGVGLELPFQVISVPEFNTLTINAGVTVSAPAWDGKTGGIIAFKVKGDCTINGKLITSGLGPTRTDYEQLTHGSLLDKFICNTGGGIFIMCGGKFTAPSTARIGATWSGAGKGGAGVYKGDGVSGGAGYGGGGGGSSDVPGTGGSGGVGGGGGGGDDYRKGFNAGYNNRTGGAGASVANYNGNLGGTQGITPGGNSPAPTKYNTTGGGGAGGNASKNPYLRNTYSGANLILITKALNVDEAAISTGGEGGHKVAGAPTGGGGTGFCYIACEEMM